MCSRHAEPGATSEYVLHGYKVLACNRWDEDDRFTIRIRSAMGPHDARSQARLRRPDASILQVTEVSDEERQRWAAEDCIDVEAKGAA